MGGAAFSVTGTRSSSGNLRRGSLQVQSACSKGLLHRKALARAQFEQGPAPGMRIVAALKGLIQQGVG